MDKNNKNKINRNFISNIDNVLADFDSSHKLSSSQQAEIAKYRKIYDLRDNPTAQKAQPDDLWK